MHRTLLAATLAASLLSATPVLEPLWRFLGSLWGEEGCILDPNGRCLTASSAGVDAGCIIDPNGRCSPAAQAAAGCIIDPDGRCAG
jgi:hypothetical protein